MSRIIAVAIFQDGVIYSLAAPARHHHVIAHMVRDVDLPIPIKGKQGFVDDTGHFLSRAQALKVAKAAGQIIRRCGGDNHELFSENLW